ncbi:hypothetical protein CFP56_017459 [Quercus suber]|uniref:Rx N-terminal domain-containing protein n=1 Tax=Quercus suber TaxID=58331 RepID=A0AAW0KMB6_QUESU
MDESEAFVIVCVTAPLLLHKLQNLLNYESKETVREAIDQLKMISRWLRDPQKIDLNAISEFWGGFLKELHDLEDGIDNLIMGK